MVHSFKEYNWLERVLGSNFAYLSRILDPLVQTLKTSNTD
jgi:hypothetical protein